MTKRSPFRYFKTSPEIIRLAVEGAIFQYINGFHNPRRRHSSQGVKSPLAFEQKAAEMNSENGT
jgi:hypothetical protein